MVKIKFQLDKPTAERTVIIVSVRIGVDSERIRLSSGESIEPNKWDQKKQRAKKGYRFEKSVNDRLLFIETAIKDEYARLVNNGIAPTKSLLRERIAERLNPKPSKPEEKPITIWEGFDLYRESHSATFAPATIALYGSIKNHLEAFNKAYKLNLTWETLTLPFFKSFEDYLLKVRQVKNATLEKIMKHLRAVLRWGEEQKGVPVHADYKRFTKKNLPKGESSQKIYLTGEELTKLWELDLSDNERLARVRDGFLFHCYTGLRFSDGQALQPEHRKGDNFHLVTKKNRKEIRIPLHPRAKDIWERWEGTLPKISNQKFNKYIQEVCQLAGMNELEVVVSYSGSKRIEEKIPKWQLVSSHTGKRTAVTNLLLSNKVSLEAICAITGNTLKTIQQYIVPTSEDSLRQIRQAWGEE
ncbi:MAG: phage integrase SAM-like domain-containing protein [Armatimonadetes bacterium]|nr:phage integrase SAM-like domain-containing protein [Armatimonadota bacterium]